jgi:hypothetical protein
VHSAAAAFAVKFRCNSISIAIQVSPSKLIQAAHLHITVRRAQEAKQISSIACLAGTGRRQHESNHPDRSLPKVAPHLRGCAPVVLKKHAALTPWPLATLVEEKSTPP